MRLCMPVSPGFVGLLSVFSCLWLAGCQKPRGSGEPTNTDRNSVARVDQPQATVPVQLGYQRIGAPFLLKARNQGLLKELAEKSATPVWKEFKTGPSLLEAMNAKEVDIGYVGETPPVFAQSAGVSFVYVASDPPAPKAEAIVVLKDSPIKTVADLKGKRVALNRGSNVHYLLVRALERAKLTINDVTVVYLPPGDARPAFETGKVDAWVIWDPFFAAAELAGGRALVNGEGLVDNQFHYVVRREFAEQRPELVRTVLEQYRALSEWESQNSEASAKLLTEATGVSYEALLLAERRHAYGLQPISDATLQRQQAIADTFQRLELIPKPIRVADAFLPAVVYAAKQ